MQPLLPVFRVECSYVQALAQTIPVTPGTPEAIASALTLEFVLSGIAEQYAKDHAISGSPVWQEVEGWMLCGFRASEAEAPAVESLP